MRERDWDTLVWSLQYGNCILLLGPDLPEDAEPSAGRLAEVLAEQLSERDAARGWALPAIAQRFLAESGRTDLEREVVQFFSSQAAAPSSKLMQTLAALPFYLVITSRHDDSLARAQVAQGKTPSMCFYRYRGDNPAYLPVGSPEAPVLYHLYGSVSEPHSLVLTENDLLDFLVAVISKTPPLPTSIRSELQKREKCYLFLGFGIRHWYLRILLHALQLSQSESRSFALEPLLQQPSPERDQTILFYRTGYRLEVVDNSPEPFLEELCGRLARAGGIRASEERGPVRTGPSPRVFVCHASEDHAAALDLCRALESAGLRPWIDRLSLQAGDDWDHTIQASIRDSDYFLVLQSRHLVAKEFSYVNKEIRLALDRQGFARTSTRYLIPLQIDDSDPLPELRDIQAQPLRNPADVQALISTLKRDAQRRARR
jgi:hypothetical protein